MSVGWTDVKWMDAFTGWPRTLENRENGEKNSLQGKIREFEILLKIREFQKILAL